MSSLECSRKGLQPYVICASIASHSRELDIVLHGALSAQHFVGRRRRRPRRRHFQRLCACTAPSTHCKGTPSWTLRNILWRPLSRQGPRQPSAPCLTAVGAPHPGHILCPSVKGLPIRKFLKVNSAIFFILFKQNRYTLRYR